MRLPKLLFAAALLCAAAPASGDESFQGALQRGAATHPALYSFADLYRLAVSGQAPGIAMAPAAEAPMRTAVGQPAAQFSVADVPEPQLGLLLLSGVALAVWVARRRLGYAF